MADVKLSQLAAASPASRAAGAALWTHKGHIEGLKLEWVSGTSLRVTSGSAYIESLGYAIDVPAAITKAGLALAASTWYHVYLFVNAGVPDIEVVTTAPAAAYSGTARSKTADTSRRWLGRVRTDGVGALRDFAIRGCQLSLANPAGGGATFSVPNATDTALPFGFFKFDAYGMFSSGAPTDIVIPEGVRRIRATFSASFSPNTTGDRLGYVSKNGANYPGRCAQRITAPTGYAYMNGTSGVIEVATSDVFRLQVIQGSGAALNVTDTDGAYTWLNIEVIEDDYFYR